MINGAGGRRHWSMDDKARIVAETLEPNAIISEVARRQTTAGVRLAPRSAQTGRFGAAGIPGLRAGGGDGAASGTRTDASSTAAEGEDDPRRWRDRA
nr:transposase [Mesorhizobium sp. B2-8-9]